MKVAAVEQRRRYGLLAEDVCGGRRATAPGPPTSLRGTMS